MLYRIFAYAAVGITLAATQAEAATYTYTGIPSPGDTFVIPGDPSSGVAQYYVSATVDLSCAGPCASGTYSEGGTLTSFTLSIDGPTPSNASVFSISNTDPNYISSADPSLFGAPSSVTLSNVGGAITITDWSVFADLGPDPSFTLNSAIYTVFQNPDPNNDSQDYYADGLISSGTLNANPGVWSGPGIAAVSATPLPATLPLFAGGLGLMGLLSRRRKRKSTTALAAA